VEIDPKKKQNNVGKKMTEGHCAFSIRIHQFNIDKNIGDKCGYNDHVDRRHKFSFSSVFKPHGLFFNQVKFNF